MSIICPREIAHIKEKRNTNPEMKKWDGGGINLYRKFTSN
jgi:hypothetical protein